MNNRGFRLQSDDFAFAWAIGSVVMAFLLGVLCGGEEEENKTSDFAKRLPIPQWRILAEKIGGSFAAFCCWALVAMLINVFLGGLFGISPVGLMAETINRVSLTICWGALLFCSGLVAGAWTRKVIVGAVLGGVSGWLYGNISLLLIHRGDLRAALLRGDWPFKVFAAGCLIALFLTFVRYQTREGT